MNKILVTGGAGYIGSQTVKELKDEGFSPVVFDNLTTGHKEAILGAEFFEGDLNNFDDINEAIKQYRPEAVIHFAAATVVSESVTNPEKYWQNNLVAGLNLLKAMRQNNLFKIIFSSSAAVYGNAKEIPVTEKSPRQPLSPYGLSKAFFEDILSSYKAYGLQSIALRYFNAAGAEPSGTIGSASKESTLLIERAIMTALDKYPHLEIFGDDYATPDGTCIRDFVHVKDLARAHIMACKALEGKRFSPIYNLGTGRGYSVKEVVEMTKKISQRDFKVVTTKRRPGDLEKMIADNTLAKTELGFKPQFSDLATIIETTWKWRKNNPEGYGGRNDKIQMTNVKSNPNNLISNI